MDFMVHYMDTIGNVRFDKVDAINFGAAIDIIRRNGEVDEVFDVNEILPFYDY